MPDLLAHYAVGFLIASRVFRFRVALILAFVGLLPDIDALLMVHRWVTHSLILALFVGVLAFLVSLRFSGLASRYVLAALLLYATHIVMDVFTAPTPALWPLVDSSLMVKVNVNGLISHDGLGVIPALSIESLPSDFTRRYFIEGPIISAHGIILFLAVAAATSIELITGKTRGARI